MKSKPSFKWNRIQLGYGLKKLDESNDFDELLFWGRIRGNAYIPFY